MSNKSFPRTFWTADLHLGHANVIDYDNRPFADVKEMDEEIIRRWNKVVSKNDIVWILGDITLSGNKEYIKDKISRLNGRKRLIMGNHDICSDDFYRECGFEYVSKWPIIIHDFFVLSHEPMQYMGENCPLFFIYGHVHNDEKYQTWTEHSACVSITRHNYVPVEIAAYNKYIEDNDGKYSKKFNPHKR